MKKFSTIICCLAIAVGGWFAAQTTPIPTNTISAEPRFVSMKDYFKTPDTVTVEGPRDTIVVTQTKITTKYRIKSVKDTIQRVDTVEVPVLYTKTDGKRKEISPDSLLSPSHKRVNRKVIELND